MKWRKLWLNSPYARLPQHVAPLLDTLEELFPIAELVELDDPEFWLRLGHRHAYSPSKTISKWLTQAMLAGLITPRESANLKVQLDIF